MAFYQFTKEQFIPSSIEIVWEFISSPENLKKITPEYMGFNITSGEVPQKMYQGMIISYKVSPFFRIQSDWVTEITHIQEHKFFVDEQRLGPYQFWHHQHLISPVDNGVLMKDIITYSPPLGWLGAIMNRLFIRNKIDEIFNYRTQKIKEIFG